MKKQQKRTPAQIRFAVTWANTHLFSPDRKLSFKRIQSRNLIWCRGGCGALSINGQNFPMTPGDFVFTPADFSITYEAGPKEPFYVGSIHLFPVPARKQPLSFFVFHNPPHPQSIFPDTPPTEITGIPPLLHGSFRKNIRTEHLADYITEWFTSPLRTEESAAKLAELLTDELRSHAVGEASGFHLSPLLIQLQDFIETNLHKHMTLAGLAENAGCSTATVTRLFRQELGTPPVHWINQLRMKKAAELLRTTAMRIGEIGTAVGIPDPYHFSRKFRRFHGISASEYRSRNRTQTPDSATQSGNSKP